MQAPNANDAAPEERLRETLQADVLAADLKCSFFLSALQSYKRDSVLRPFPGFYATEDVKDFEALVSRPGVGWRPFLLPRSRVWALLDLQGIGGCPTHGIVDTLGQTRTLTYG